MITFDGSSTYSNVPQNGSDVVVKNTQAVLCACTITVLGTGATQIFDNATAGAGNLVAVIPASPAVGTRFPFFVPVSNGITVKGGANNSSIVVTFA